MVSGQRCHRVAVAHRPKTYPFRSHANLLLRKPAPDKQRRKVYHDDPGGQGQEIVREVLMCARCATGVPDPPPTT